MELKSVEFINSNGQGINADLLCVKEYLSKSENCEYKFLSGREKGNKNPFEKKGLRTRRKVFCNNISNAVCTDASIPIKLNPKAKSSKRILMLVPYDNYFKLANLIYKGKRVNSKKSFSNFTHILPGSKFGTDLLSNFYQFKGKIIENVNSPFSYSLFKEEKRCEARKMIEFYFPQAKGKKIISVITTVAKSNKQLIDTKKFLDSLDEEYFVLTNCMEIFEQLEEISNKYSKRLGYIKNLIQAENVLYVSDCLITNIGRHAAEFCVTGKPVFCLRYRNNAFEKYMNRKFESMYIDSIDDKTFNKLFCAYSEQKRFRDYFSYSSNENPCEIIKNIID